VSNEELRRLLVGAVPETPVPTDRWATVAGRVRRRQRQRLATTVAVGVVVLLALGAGLTRLTPVGQHAVPLPPAGHGSPSASPSPAPENRLGPPLTVPTSPRPPGVAFDAGRIPPGSPGSSVARVVRTGEMPTRTSDGTGIFRTVCLYSHMTTDDPFTSGISYLHMYWGRTPSGNSTCRGGTVDRSSYWLPALIDTKTGTPLAPDLVHVYFDSGYLGVRPQQVQPMPAGLRMQAQAHGGWKCWDVGGSTGPTMPKCGSGDELDLELYFPQCWNGRDLDSADHRSHMAYAVEGHGCPAGYPVALPEISYHVLYPIGPNTDTSGWRLAWDTVQGGWVNGWAADILTTWIQGCVRVAMTCGSHMLGDGRVLQGDK